MSKTIIIILVTVIAVVGGVYYIKGGFSSDNGIDGTVENGEESGGGEEIPTTEPKSNVTVTKDMCIEVMAHVNRGVELLAQQDTAGMTAMGKKVKELEKKYGIDAASDELAEACNRMMDADFSERLSKRMIELGSPAGQ